MKGSFKGWVPERGFGFVTPDDGSSDVFLHESRVPNPEDLYSGAIIEFDFEETEKGRSITRCDVLAPGSPEMTGVKPSRGAKAVGTHENHCFVVMPHGRDRDEVRWFQGWYELVIREAVVESGYQPILSKAQDIPSAINDEIRTHLAFDPMVVVDLGGRLPSDLPNPNVMYELGIRHALDLPLVMLAWAGQALPFDISNQRVLMERRELLDVPRNRERLVRFIREAEAGNYYRPMQAVQRVASLELAETSYGRDSIMVSLIREVRDLRGRITGARPLPKRKKATSSGSKQKNQIKAFLGTKAQRKKLYRRFADAGGTNDQWQWLLRRAPTPEFVETAVRWDAADREAFVGAFRGVISGRGREAVGEAIEVALLAVGDYAPTDGVDEVGDPGDEPEPEEDGGEEVPGNDDVLRGLNGGSHDA